MNWSDIILPFLPIESGQTIEQLTEGCFGMCSCSSNTKEEMETETKKLNGEGVNNQPPASQLGNPSEDEVPTIAGVLLASGS